jgi:hypothetical protein
VVRPETDLGAPFVSVAVPVRGFHIELQWPRPQRSGAAAYHFLSRGRTAVVARPLSLIPRAGILKLPRKAGPSDLTCCKLDTGPDREPPRLRRRLSSEVSKNQQHCSPTRCCGSNMPCYFSPCFARYRISSPRGHEADTCIPRRPEDSPPCLHSNSVVRRPIHTHASALAVGARGRPVHEACCSALFRLTWQGRLTPDTVDNRDTGTKSHHTAASSRGRKAEWVGASAGAAS